MGRGWIKPARRGDNCYPGVKTGGTREDTPALICGLGHEMVDEEEKNKGDDMTGGWPNKPGSAYF